MVVGIETDPVRFACDAGFFEHDRRLDAVADDGEQRSGEQLQEHRGR